MAEFVRTIKDWQRMCRTIKSCDDCPLQKADGLTYVICSEGGITSARPEIAEKAIAKWAEEHPEPVYPRWIDWLADVGLIINTADHYTFDFTAAVDRIPADIAEKLWIEPKEG